MLFYVFKISVQKTKEKDKINRPALNLLFDHIIIQDSIFKLSWHHRRCKNKVSAATPNSVKPFNKTETCKVYDLSKSKPVIVIVFDDSAKTVYKTPYSFLFEKIYIRCLTVIYKACISIVDKTVVKK